MTEQKKLLESFSNFVESQGDPRELERVDKTGRRKFVYRDWGAVAGGDLTTLTFRVRDGHGWREVLDLRQTVTNQNIDLDFNVGCWWVVPFYDKRGRMSINHFKYEGETFNPFRTDEQKADLKELLFDWRLIPAILDAEMTATLFLDQVVRGDFSKPVLVRRGLFRYDPPRKLSETSVAYASNITRIARLLGTGKNVEENRTLEAIFRWVVDKEAEGVVARRRGETWDYREYFPDS